MDERRRHSRIRSKFEMACEIRVSGRTLYTVTQDVSESGIRLSSTKRLEIGTPVRIKIDFPNRDEPVRFEAEVVWCEEFMKAGTQVRLHGYEIGARFTAISENDKRLLTEYGKYRES